MTQMENEPMLTDLPEERIERLEKRLKSIERHGVNFETEQQLRSDIFDVRVKLGIEIDDLKELIQGRIQSPPKADIDNPLYLEDYIGIINSDLGEASKLLEFLYENWHRVRVKK